MALDSIALCNLALIELGGAYEEEAISSIDDTESKAARFCKRLFQQTMDEVVACHRWKCATVRASLGTPLSESPAYEYDYAYLLPSDPYCLRVLQLEDPRELWTKNGRHLLCNVSSGHFEYLRRITNPADLDPLCAEAVYTKLASKLAKSLAGSDELRVALENKYYKIILPNARHVDAKESGIRTITSTGLLNARY